MSVHLTSVAGHQPQTSAIHQSADDDVVRQVIADSTNAQTDAINHALIGAAATRLEADMHAHGGGHLAGIAQGILRDGAQILLADPGRDFAENLDILRAHVLHHTLVRGGVITDENAPMTGPISVPRLREGEMLDTYLVAFPEIAGAAPEVSDDPARPGPDAPVSLPPGIEPDHARQIALSEKRHELAQSITKQMAAHGAPHLQLEAQRLFLQATAGGPDVDNPFAGQNLEIMAAHIGHHLLARNGNIDDPAAPREGSIQVPQHLPSGELHFVEVAMERLNRSG